MKFLHERSLGRYIPASASAEFLYKNLFHSAILSQINSDNKYNFQAQCFLLIVNYITEFDFQEIADFN